MTALLFHLEVVGLVVVNAAITIGLLVAVGKTALGRRDGYRHLVAVCVAAGLLILFTTGQLAATVLELVSSPAPAASQAPLAPEVMR